MERWLARLIADYERTEEPAVRSAYGRLCGKVGVGSNLLLFVMKLLAGGISGSIAIVADGINNLSDAASSLVTLIGFRLAEKEADREHPFGHGRIEYVAGLVVSGLILLVGMELGQTSVKRILHPQAVELSWLTALILAASVGLKVAQFFFNRTMGRRIDSASLLATARDSLSDAAATGVILAGSLINQVFSLQIDGFLGLFVTVLILRAGVLSAKETLDPLLGAPPSCRLVEDITQTVLAHREILGVHDLTIHDYGPGRSMMSLHAEVDYRADILDIHDIIDDIERELGEKFRTVAVIHMDPIVTDDPKVNEMRALVEALVAKVDPALTIHDFRMTSGGRHVNLIFDVAVPFELTQSDEELIAAIRQEIAALPGAHFAVIEVDRVYIPAGE